MNKLNPKEMFMVIVLVNVVVYYLGYLIIATPLLKVNSVISTQYQEAKNENAKIKEEIAQNEEYVKQITLAENSRAEYYDHSYPYAREEIIHEFISEKLKAHGLVLTSIKVEEEVDDNAQTTATTNEDGSVAQPVESIFKSYVIDVNYVGNFKNTKEFLTDIESLDKTAAVTKLDIGKSESGAATNVTFNMVTVDKGDQNEKDTTFNFTATNAQGGGYNDLRIN